MLEVASRVQRNFAVFRDADRPEKTRMAKNQRLYTGINNGQWDPTSLQVLQQERRPANQFNIIQPQIDELVGNFLQNEFETKYDTEIGDEKYSESSLALQKRYIYDKGRGNWSDVHRQFLTSFFIYRGIKELYIDYRNDPRGSIGMRYVDPNYVWTDPDWKSTNINDNDRIFKVAWMSPAKIMGTFKSKKAQIQDSISLYSDLLEKDREEDLRVVADRSPDYYDRINGKYLVIEEQRLEWTEEPQVFDTETSTFATVKDVEGFLTQYGNDGRFVEKSKRFLKLMIRTICPGINRELVLYDGPHPIQIGRYPMFIRSAGNLHGEVYTPVDLLEDIQTTINKRESQFTHWQTTAINGAEFIHERFFADDEEYQRYLNYGNTPGTKYKVKMPSQEGIAQRPRQNVPNDLLNSADRALNYRNEIGPTAPALRASGGKSGESEALFSKKVDQALVRLEPTNQILISLEKEIGEAYFYLAKQVYWYPTSFVDKATKKPILMNHETEGGVVNDFRLLPRMGVNISAGPSSASVKQQRLNMFIQSSNLFTNPVVRSQYEMEIMKTLPGITETDLEKMTPMFDMQTQLQKARMMAEMNQIQQAMQPQGQPGLPQPGPSKPGQTPQEGGGLSVEGKSIPSEGGLPVDFAANNQFQ